MSPKPGPLSIEEQVAQLMIVSKDGVHAVCLNPDARHYLWVHYDNHGTWVSLRPALPSEVEHAKIRLSHMEVFLDIPQRG